LDFWQILGEEGRTTYVPSNNWQQFMNRQDDLPKKGWKNASPAQDHDGTADLRLSESNKTPFAQEKHRLPTLTRPHPGRSGRYDRPQAPLSEYGIEIAETWPLKENRRWRWGVARTTNVDLLVAALAKVVSG